MFKRANKITALLVAAAAVVSIVPATAANASDRLGTKDGTITNALAYQDGKYVYEGYKSDDDDNGIYYGAGDDKDKSLEDLEDANLNTPAYGDKYAYANDGSDQYLVDLSNGDVIDDDAPEDNADTAATKLKSALKKTDRYGDLTDVDSHRDLGYKDATDDVSDDEVVTGILPGNKFGDSWYAYGVEPVDPDSNTSANLVKGKLYGFTNASGKYIDASNLANIYAYSTKKGKMVKIEEYSNNIDDVDDESDLLATLVKAPVVLTQDKDYIYALVTVDITDVNDSAVSTNGTTTGAAAIVGDTSEYSKLTTTTRTYIQKISKEQGDNKDDAYLPKTVESYEVGNTSFTKTVGDKNVDVKELDCGDASDAYDAITEATGVSDLSELTQEDVVYSNDGKVKPLFTVNGDKLVVVRANTENVKATTILFKKDKVKFDSENNLPGYKGSATGYDIKDKVDAYLVEKDDDDDVDIDVDDQDVANDAYDFDVDGNLWVVADGEILEFKDNEMTKVYSCDSALDSISAYDSNNLIAWENDGDIYTTVAEGSAETAGEATPAQTGWVNTATGWTFYDAAGKQVVGSWVNAGGVWYMIKADGIMATGWYNDNGTWYFLNASGAMQTGWYNDNGTWYFLKSSGAMQTGWLNDNGTWYYLNSNGSMAANTTVDGYTLGASGAWIQ